MTSPARRIVSLVPSLTETLFTLGCGDSVVAVTRYCTEPHAALAHVRRVGGTKDPDLTAVLEAEPDLVVMDRDENRKEDFAALSAAGLRVFVAEVRRLADVERLLVDLGQLTGTAQKARRRAASLRATCARIAGVPSAGRPRVFCPVWKNPWMSFRRDSYPGALLHAAGADNVCASTAERYPKLAATEIARLLPEVILLPDEPYRFRPKDLQSVGEVFRTAPAWRHRRVYFIDGKSLTWFGVRTERGLVELHRLLAGGW